MDNSVTVIIPVKNRKLELERAINSVINQTYTNWELLVVDDKSSIHIKGITETFNDQRIKYFLNASTKSNANVCRNIGLANATGNYVAMLDSDDEWLPTHLEARLNFLQQQKCDGIFGGAYIDNGNVRTLKLNQPFNSNKSMADYILKYGGAPTPTHFYTLKSAKETLWDEDLLRHQDYDFCIRYSERFKFVSFDDPTTIIHWKLNQKRIEDFNSQIRFMNKHKDKFSKVLYKKYYVEHYNNLRDRQDVSTFVKNHFKTEALKHSEFLSLTDYCMIFKPKNVIQKIITRFKFSFKILTHI